VSEGLNRKRLCPEHAKGKQKAKGESESRGRTPRFLIAWRRSILIETFGCQMNVHDSERMAGLLDQAGYESTTDDGDADVIVINTCSVREHAEEKLYTRLGELRVLEEETGHHSVIAVAGLCRAARRAVAA
jgi:tRNA A37 methylthiotransferase MiaB